MNPAEEIWLPLKHDAKWEVSNKGNVRVTKSKAAVGVQFHTHGYRQVHLEKRYSIHRLVAMAFIPNPENKPVVRHLDGTVYNNRVENLAWGTHQENSDDMVRHGKPRKKKGEKEPVVQQPKTTKHPITEQEIDFIRTSGLMPAELAIFYDASAAIISVIQRGGQP